MALPVSPLAVCVVSPHLFFIQELARVLGAAEADVSSHHIAYSLAPRLHCECRADGRVWVVDACLPPQSTEALVGELREAHPGCRIIAVAEALTEDLVYTLLRAGVRGFLTYEEAHERIALAVAAVAQGRIWIPRAHLAGFVELLLGQEPAARAAGRLVLSQREKEVLPLLLQNLSNKEIASRLIISERTVMFHVSNLLSEFGAEMRSDLMLRALRGVHHPA